MGYLIQRLRGREKLHLEEPSQPALTVCLLATAGLARRARGKLVELCRVCLRFNEE